MKTKTKTKTKADAKAKAPPKRDRSNCLLIDLGTLRPALQKLATIDSIDTGEPMNFTRTVRRLIREEAARRGIQPKNP